MRSCRVGAAGAITLAALACGPSGAPPALTVTVTPTRIELSAPELVNPGRGFYRWHDAEPIPQPRPALDHYARFS